MGEINIPAYYRPDAKSEYLPVTEIEENAFRNCENITAITIPAGVRSIGKSAFYWCSYLASISIPDSVTSIGNEAFDGCKKIASITIPASVRSVGAWAFNAWNPSSQIINIEGSTDGWNPYWNDGLKVTINYLGQ